MRNKFLKLCTIVISFLLLLTGCAAGNEEETEPVNKIPSNAIFPVMVDARSGSKSRTIQLSDKAIVLPEGYVYGKEEFEADGYTIYYVWQDKKEKEYSFNLDADIMLYIYDGLDSDSPHKEINKVQALSSMKTGYMNQFVNLVTLRNRMPDAEVGLSDDGRYYTYSFTGNSGDYISTTYADACYPKTYYGIYTLETKTRSSDRRYYGFIFSNDSTGEIFKQSEYEDLLSQIKNGFNISKFYSLPNAAQEIDFSDGRSYKQLVAEIIYQKEGSNYYQRGLFYNTLLYYIETTGRNYVRKNVDGSKSQATTPTEPTVIETEIVIEELEATGEAGVETESDVSELDVTESVEMETKETKPRDGTDGFSAADQATESGGAEGHD